MGSEMCIRDRLWEDKVLHAREYVSLCHAWGRASAAACLYPTGKNCASTLSHSSGPGPRGAPRAENHGFWALLGSRDPDSCENGAGGSPRVDCARYRLKRRHGDLFQARFDVFRNFFSWKFWPETGLGVPAAASTPERARSEKKMQNKLEKKVGRPRKATASWIMMIYNHGTS